MLIILISAIIAGVAKRNQMQSHNGVCSTRDVAVPVRSDDGGRRHIALEA